MKNDLDALIQEHNLIHCKNIGIGAMPGNIHESFEGVSGFIQKCNEIGAKMKEQGKQLCYHNHAFEFDKVNGKTHMERLSDSFSKDELSFTIDTYWVQKAGGDPVWWLNRFKDRIPCVHLKDMDFTGDMAPVGSGNMNWDAILKVCETTNTEYLLVEQDNCNAQNAIECLTKSYKYLTSLGLK
jgi:sugar phosphate isomerase/epimerase